MKKLSLSPKEIASIIKKNWSSKTNEQLGLLVGKDKTSIRRWAIKLGLPAKANGGHNKIMVKPLSTAEHLALDIEKISAKKQTVSVDSKYKALLKEVDKLEDERKMIYQTKDVFNEYLFKYKPLNKDTESIAVVLASDWHVGEEIKSQWTNGLNSFSPEIATKCAEEFFQNTVKLLIKESTATKIDTLVLALLGDFITNFLHEENVETNLLHPADEILLAQSLIRSGIKYILDNTKVNIIIPCHYGNHSRTTDKVHFSNEGGNSFEKIMYQNLEWNFQDEKRVKFIISEAYVSYLDIGGYTIAFHHGHGMKFGGAIGGITTAVVKWVEKTERGRKADLYCFGHHHTQFDGRFFLANGSMIGYGARSLALGYGYEPRAQTFFLINMKYKRKTVTCPILFKI